MSPAGPAARSGESATAQWYRHFGTFDAPGSSPCYAEWAVGIADDDELIRRIEQWPHNKRQPLLILAAARFLGAQVSPYRQFRSFLDDHWASVSEIVLSRATQTNEAGRCATLLPSLARISAAQGQPLALIEVGASAGLALYPDCYGYEFVASLPEDKGAGGGPRRRRGGGGGRRGRTGTPRTPGPRGWFRPAPGLAHSPFCGASRPGRCRCRRSFPRWCGAPGSTSTPWTCATLTMSPGWKPSCGPSRSSVSAAAPGGRDRPGTAAAAGGRRPQRTAHCARRSGTGRRCPGGFP